jgi:agmatinase
MSLRIEPLPRMAGHLPFMRGRLGSLGDLKPGMVGAFGLGSGRDSRTDLAPLAMRETSAYFGSHFNANMKSAMDIDQRRALNSAAMAGAIVDLGDLLNDPVTSSFDVVIQRTVAGICGRGALPLMLGGEQRGVAPAIAGLRENAEAASQGIAVLLVSTTPQPFTLEARDVHCLVSASPRSAGNSASLPIAFRDLRQRFEDSIGLILAHLGKRPVHVALDASALASHWHGTNRHADFDGLSLSECRALLRKLGAANIASLSITGLDPAINGLSLVKTGQRLLLTAILDLIYARLDVLGPRMERI